MTGAVRGARRAALALAAVLVAASVVSAGAPGAGAGTDGPPSQVLSRNMRGEQALSALGDRLPVAAARNDLTPAQFRAAVRKDSMVWVDRTGRLLFVDEFDHGDHEHADTSTLDEATAAVPEGTDVLDLHSRPGANRTIVLDFDGHDAQGTAWGNTTAQLAGAYNFDGDPANFSDAERTEIYGVWQRVAEDYAPFDVNVTTKDPGHGPGTKGAAIIRRDDVDDQIFGTRVVITPSKPYNCSCGGVAYVGVFDETGSTHDHYQPAWVFTAGVGNGAKNIAEAASHEAGHNLGLSHDGTRSTGYYTGHGNWAPIMGVGYHEPITQWSRGEYSGANNKEDDFAVISAHGAPAAADDFGSTISASTAALSGTIAGTIGSRGDLDVFSFTPTLTGVATISADPASTSPNLDIRLRLLSSSGSVLATADPASSGSSGNDTSVGLDADLVANVVAGTTYFVEVDGVGFGDPGTTGYSDYGSVGRFTLSATVTEGTVTPPPTGDTTPAAPSNATASGSSTVTIAWTDNSTNEDGFEVWREKKVKGRWQTATKVVTTPANATSATDRPGKGTFRYLVRAFDGTFFSDYSNYTAEIAGAR